MTARGSDLALGSAAIALSAAWLVAAGRIPDSLLSDAVGAAGLPRVLGWAAGLVGVLLCARGIAAAVPARQEAEKAAGLRPHLRALGLLAILAGYVVVAPWLGYAVSTGLLLAAGAAYAGAARDRNLVLIPIAAAALFWLLFVVAFGIPMPGSTLFPRA